MKSARFLILTMVSIGIHSIANAGAPQPACRETAKCGAETISCNALTYTPKPTTTDHKIFTWGTGTCTEFGKTSSCEQKSSIGGIQGPILESSDMTTYVCCDHSGVAFTTGDPALAAAQCDHSTEN